MSLSRGLVEDLRPVLRDGLRKFVDQEILSEARNCRHGGRIIVVDQTSPSAANSTLTHTKKLPGEGSKRPWPPLIKMDEAATQSVDRLFNH